MQNHARIFTLYAVLVLGAACVFGAGAEAPEDPALLAMTDEQALVLPPLLFEIRTVLLEQRAATVPLRTALDGATDPQEIRDLERRLAAVLEDGEIRIYEIQAAFARREGRTDDADHFETLAEQVRRPAVRKDVAAKRQRDGEVQR